MPPPPLSCLPSPCSISQFTKNAIQDKTVTIKLLRMDQVRPENGITVTIPVYLVVLATDTLLFRIVAFMMIWTNTGRRPEMMKPFLG